jgi:hypothetical protein
MALTWDGKDAGKVKRLVRGEMFGGNVQVVTTVGQCVSAIMDLPNEEIIEVVDDLLKVMDDADLYGEWAKRISDGYRRGYETN